MRWLIALALVSACDVAFGIPAVGPCDQPDEDGDRICDDTDPCPLDAGDRADVDGDSIGDLCDPHPTQPIDRVLVFDPFDDMENNWSDIGATPWVFAAGAFDHPDTTAIGQVERTVSANTEPTIEVHLAATLDTELTSVGVYVENKSNVPLECRIVHVNGGDELWMVLGQVDDNVSPLSTLKTAGPLQGFGRLRIIGGQLDDGSVRCTANYEGYPSLQVQALGGAIDPNDDFNVLGFHTIHAAASFESLMIYTL